MNARMNGGGRSVSSSRVPHLLEYLVEQELDVKEIEEKEKNYTSHP